MSPDWTTIVATRRLLVKPFAGCANTIVLWRVACPNRAGLRHQPFTTAATIPPAFSAPSSLPPGAAAALEKEKFGPSVPERGKSRLGKALIYLSWRGVHTESLNEAFILRLASNYQASIFFDVMDVWQKAERKGSEDVLLGRYERGIKVPRVLYPDRGAFQDTVYFGVFGPTLIGTNFPLNGILETRAITINMPKTSQRFNNDVRPELCQVLKERLLAFRARHMQTVMANCDKPADGRLGDILRPLQQTMLLVAPDLDDEFRTFVQETEAERKVEKAETLEARIVSAVQRAQINMHDSLLYVKDVTAQLNEGKPQKEWIRDVTVGKKLRALGFSSVRQRNGAAIRKDDQLVQRLVEEHGLGAVMVENLPTPLPIHLGSPSPLGL